MIKENKSEETVKTELLQLIQSGMLPSKAEIEKANALFKVCKSQENRARKEGFEAARKKQYHYDKSGMDTGFYNRYEDYEDYLKSLT